MPQGNKVSSVSCLMHKGIDRHLNSKMKNKKTAGTSILASKMAKLAGGAGNEMK